jgi:protein-L-isoaspartate(D-aspartate) O-methyltransferase
MLKSIETKRSGCFYKTGKHGFYLFSAIIILSLSVLHCRADDNTGRDYAFQRERMVVEQIQARNIRNPEVLKAMRTVPRDQFVPENIRHLAYGDHALPIGEGQTISQPYIVALMTDTIMPEKNMKVLEIGTGSGYQAAILAELCRSVYTIEIIEKLGRQAERILTRRYQNVFVKIGDGYQGWPEAAPFDAILVTCAPTKVPRPLADQLKEGGRMVIPIGKIKQELVVLVKRNGQLEREAIIPVLFVPMVDQKGKSY